MIQAVTVTIRDRWECLATTAGAVSARAISTASAATNAAKVSTTSLLAKTATAIHQVSSKRSPDVDQCLKASCANAKSASREESATSANHSFGTCRLRTRWDVKAS